MSKITLGQSIRIKNMVASGISIATVAAQFGITEERVKGFCTTLKKPVPKKRAKKVKKEVEDAQEGSEEKQES